MIDDIDRVEAIVERLVDSMTKESFPKLVIGIVELPPLSRAVKTEVNTVQTMNREMEQT